jgi:Kelch motif
MPSTLVNGVWRLPPLALLMLVLLLALAVPGAAQETWTPTSTVGAPSARLRHTAVWTGSKMIVWGGSGLGGTYSNTDGVYDPATDTWTATSTTSAPAARYSHTAVWTGSGMIVWGGGISTGGYTNTGGAYDPATDTWTATSTTNAPTGRCVQTAVWTGSKMVVRGGFTGPGVWGVSAGGVYSNPAVIPPPPPSANFYTVTPCRLVDTRNPASPTGGPALLAGAVRSFPVTGGACGLPPTAIAVSVNLTVTQPAAQG